MTQSQGPRTGGQILIDQLAVQGTEHVFCVPGESYLAALDALHDSDIAITICRQEGGAAMMAEAAGKLTGRPGICFVTRGPGATNAAHGVHIAKQDSTPMILFVGQVARDMREREAFQELDYRAVFGSMTKWTTEIDDPARIPETISRAFHIAMSGRPGPVVIALPEDMLTELAVCEDARRVHVPDSAAPESAVAQTLDALAKAKRPLIVLGGSRWDTHSVADMHALAERLDVPIAVSFRRQMLFDASHTHFAGDLALSTNPALLDYAKSSDLIVLLGGRMSEIASQSYTLLGIPNAGKVLVHVHPGAEELGRVYQPDIAINCAPGAFVSAMLKHDGPAALNRSADVERLHTAYLDWSTPKPRHSERVDMNHVMTVLRDKLPADAIMANGAGNYATWLHRFHRFTRYGTQLAPTSGSMGYGVPAAVAAARIERGRTVIAFAGDGCFLMNGQEFATAVQYDLPLVVLVIDNGMYGTIRMHQEREYPGRVVGTDLKNPDFSDYAKAFGGHGERVERSADFAPALERAIASGKPAIIHCIIDPQALTIDRTLDDIRANALLQQN